MQLVKRRSENNFEETPKGLNKVLLKLYKYAYFTVRLSAVTRSICSIFESFWGFYEMVAYFYIMINISNYFCYLLLKIVIYGKFFKLF